MSAYLALAFLALAFIYCASRVTARDQQDAAGRE